MEGPLQFALEMQAALLFLVTLPVRIWLFPYESLLCHSECPPLHCPEMSPCTMTESLQWGHDSSVLSTCLPDCLSHPTSDTPTWFKPAPQQCSSPGPHISVGPRALKIHTKEFGGGCPPRSVAEKNSCMCTTEAWVRVLTAVLFTKAKPGGNSNARLWESGWIKHGVFIQWNIL